MEKIEYAALKYYNSCISEECLYVGMLFYNVTTQTRTFNYIKNFSRLAVFDDEISIDFFKDYLSSIKEEAELNIFNYNKPFDLKEYTKPFVNELRFSKIRSETTDDPDFIENITKLFLKYDYDKKERLSVGTELKYIRRILKSSNVEYESKCSLKGKYNDTITFDIVTQDYAIKFFKFRDKKLSKLVSSARSWAYGAGELSGEKRVIFMYDEDVTDSCEFESIISILGSNAEKVLPVEAGIDYITTISSK